MSVGHIKEVSSGHCSSHNSCSVDLIIGQHDFIDDISDELKNVVTGGHKKGRWVEELPGHFRGNNFCLIQNVWYDDISD